MLFCGSVYGTGVGAGVGAEKFHQINFLSFKIGKTILLIYQLIFYLPGEMEETALYSGFAYPDGDTTDTDGGREGGYGDITATV